MSLRSICRYTMIRTLKIILVFILVFTAGMFHTKAAAEAPLVEIPTDTKGQIAYYAAIFNVKETDMMKVMVCESSENTKAVGDSGKAYGLYQYHQPTWNAFASKYRKQFGGDLLQRDNPKDQVELTAWAFKQGYQNHWTCWGKTRGV